MALQFAGLAHRSWFLIQLETHFSNIPARNSPVGHC